MNNTVLQDGQFSITKEQLRQLTDPKVKEWFPEVFEIKLKVGKWYKSFNGSIINFQGKIYNSYGVSSNDLWHNDGWSINLDTLIEATEQEVFEALKNEAVKRGFVEGAYIETARGSKKQTFGELFMFSKNELASESGSNGIPSSIFHNGKWATIIPTITKSEAEKLLNKKIID